MMHACMQILQTDTYILLLSCSVGMEKQRLDTSFARRKTSLQKRECGLSKYKTLAFQLIQCPRYSSSEENRRKMPIRNLS